MADIKKNKREFFYLCPEFFYLILAYYESGSRYSAENVSIRISIFRAIARRSAPYITFLIRTGHYPIDPLCIYIVFIHHYYGDFYISKGKELEMAGLLC